MMGTTSNREDIFYTLPRPLFRKYFNDGRPNDENQDGPCDPVNNGFRGESKIFIDARA